MSGLAAVEEEANALNVPMLANSLKAAAQNMEALASREDKLKREIEGKNREIQSLKEQLSEKAKECSEWKESASRLRVERDGLKRKNCDLECAKIRAQTDVEVYTSRFKELEGVVLTLEKKFLEITSKAEKRSEAVDLVIENVSAEPAIAEKRKGSEDFAKSEVVSEMNENPTDGSSRGKRPEKLVVILDSDDECGSDESASEINKAHPVKDVVENDQRVQKRKYYGLDNEANDVDDKFKVGKGKNLKVEDQDDNSHPREHTTQKFKTIEKGFVPPNLFSEDSSSSDDDIDLPTFRSSLYTNLKSRNP